MTQMADSLHIIAFACFKWGYGAADMAGTIRGQYPTLVRPIRVTCTGRVSPDLIMRAFGKGADGVALIGWYPAECNFNTGATHAAKNVEYLHTVMKTVGLEPERLQMHYCSAAEGQKFQKTIQTMSAEISELGPSPLRKLIKPPKAKSKKTSTKQTKPKNK